MVNVLQNIDDVFCLKSIKIQLMTSNIKIDGVTTWEYGGTHRTKISSGIYCSEFKK